MNNNLLINCLVLLIDPICIYAGVIMGAFLGKRLTKSIRDGLQKMQGIICILFAIKSCVALEHSKTALAIIILSFMLGELFQLSNVLNKVITRFSEKVSSGNRIRDPEKFANAVEKSLLISVSGSLAALGSIALANGDYNSFLIKSVLDFIGCTVLSATESCENDPKAVAVSGIFITVFQVVFFLAGFVLSPFCTALTSEMLQAVGGPLLFCCGLYLIGFDAKIKGTNYIVAFILPFILSAMLVYLQRFDISLINTLVSSL